MKIINDEQGNTKDISDEGQEVKRITDALELELAIEKLSQKEREIVRWINEGYSHREICREMEISPNTIRITLDKLMDIIK